MQKFNVTVSELNTIPVEISANDEREACDIANEMMANDEIDFSNGNTEYNIDSVYKI